MDLQAIDSDGRLSAQQVGLRYRNELVVCALIALSYCLVWPVGEYAILDDWAFVKSLQQLHENGDVTILDWNPMSLVGHILWGLCFTKLFGFSFTVTKLSVVVAHVIECVFLLRILRFCGVSDGLSLAAVIALICNPLHFIHCYMYMTDIPSLTWQVGAVYCILKALHSPRAGFWFFLGSCLSAFAFLHRQNGFIPHAALLAYIVVFNRAWLKLRYLLPAFGPLAVTIVLFQWWYRTLHGPTTTFQLGMDRVHDFLRNPPYASLPYILFTFLIYGGFFLLPLTVALPVSTYRIVSGWRRIFLGAVIWLLVNLLAYFAFANDRLFPYIRNVITPSGFFGSNVFVLGDQPAQWGRPLAWVITLACFGSLCAFFALGVKGARRQFLNVPTHTGIQFLSLLLSLQIGYVLCTSYLLFDRHLLMYAPTVLLLGCLLCRNVKSVNRRIYVPIVACMFFYSVAGTREIHAISSIAFDVGETLMTNGNSPREINAGYAFDCWHGFEEESDNVRFGAMPDWWTIETWQPTDGVSQPVNWWITFRDQTWWVGQLTAPRRTVWAVSTSPPQSPGAADTRRIEILDEYRYRSWWDFHERNIYLLKILNDVPATDVITVGTGEGGEDNTHSNSLARE